MASTMISSKGMILAAGFGTRLKPLTLERPKPLVEVLGEPLIAFSIRQLKAAGCSEAIINTHHLPERYGQLLGDSYAGVSLTYSHEHSILGTGGGIRHAEALLREGPNAFWLLQGDVIVDFDPALLVALFQKRQPLALLGLKTIPDMMGYGAVGTDKNSHVLSLGPFLKASDEARKLIVQERFFCGVHLLSGQLWDLLPPKGVVYGITDEGYPAFIKAGHTVLGAEIAGPYWDVGTPERLLDANLTLLNGKVSCQFQNPFAAFDAPKMPHIWLGHDVQIAKDAKLIAPVLLHDGAVVKSGVVLGPSVVVGKKAVIGQDVQLCESVVFSDAKVASKEKLKRAIIGQKEIICL